ncbi:MAG TPA: GNAT family N-acetyltransferase [Candidatus Binatia bacterium]|nr:GNAT family N-acetyltransferase [Candidatus Binatia bacterium]
MSDHAATAGISIRDYRGEDEAALFGIHDRSRPDELVGSCDPRGFIPLAEDFRSLEDFRMSRKWVAADGDRPVGFAGVRDNYISWLYIEPEYYRRGIGRRLLRAAMDAAGPDAWTIALERNDRARKLYESEGFVPAMTFDGENNGYPCRCVKLMLRPPKKR